MNDAKFILFAILCIIILFYLPMGILIVNLPLNLYCKWVLSYFTFMSGLLFLIL
jgi:hypothetical protein